MKVSKIRTFNEYWEDEKFQYKRPRFDAGTMYAFGDNIYQRFSDGWVQRDSHHSHNNGCPNLANIHRDTKTDRVLIGHRFAYWGGQGPKIPERFRDWNGIDFCCKGREEKSLALDPMADEFIKWFESFGVPGRVGRPLDWD